MIEKERFAGLMKGLASTTHKTFGPDEIGFWYACLKDIPEKALVSAFHQFAMTGDDWPSVAKIRKLADEQLHGRPYEAGEAWEKVLQAVRRFGYYDQKGGMGSLDELTQAALRSAGGWQWACDCTSENRQIMAAQFRRHYESLANRESELRRTPEKIRPRIGNGDMSASVEAKGQGRLENHQEKSVNDLANRLGANDDRA